jgi:hypothetical protein
MVIFLTVEITKLSSATTCQGKSFPQARVHEAGESHRAALIMPDELREYCEGLFQFKKSSYKRFRSGINGIAYKNGKRHNFKLNVTLTT